VVPAQDRVRAHQQPRSAHCGTGEQGGQEGAIGGFNTHFVGRELAWQQGDLVVQNEDFYVPVLIVHRQQA
jgi:hypothetical protein